MYLYHSESPFRNIKKSIGLFMLFLSGFFFISSLVNASSPALAITSAPNNVIWSEDQARVTGKLELQISNLSNSAMSRVQIEPVDSFHSVTGLPPVQIPLLGVSEIKISSIEVQNFPINDISALLWKLTYYVGDVKHEELISSHSIL